MVNYSVAEKEKLESGEEEESEIDELDDVCGIMERTRKTLVAPVKFSSSMWKEFTKRGVEVSLPKTGNHSQLFATSGMVSSATKDQVVIYISKMMVQFLVEYEDSNGE